MWIVAGTITFTWEFTDQCNRPNYTYTGSDYCSATSTNIYQSKVVLPFQCPNIPADDELPPLNYQTIIRICEIAGTIVPTRRIILSIVQETITYTWEFTDQCNRQITHTQVLTVVPPPAPTFYKSTKPVLQFLVPNIPTNDELPPLNYTNNASGICEISTRQDNLWIVPTIRQECNIVHKLCHHQPTFIPSPSNASLFLVPIYRMGIYK